MPRRNSRSGPSGQRRRRLAARSAAPAPRLHVDFPARRAPVRRVGQSKQSSMLAAFMDGLPRTLYRLAVDDPRREGATATPWCWWLSALRPRVAHPLSASTYGDLRRRDGPYGPRATQGLLYERWTWAAGRPRGRRLPTAGQWPAPTSQAHLDAAGRASVGDRRLFNRFRKSFFFSPARTSTKGLSPISSNPSPSATRYRQFAARPHGEPNVKSRPSGCATSTPRCFSPPPSPHPEPYQLRTSGSSPARGQRRRLGAHLPVAGAHELHFPPGQNDVLSRDSIPR